jgi:hypothetical protein
MFRYINTNQYLMLKLIFLLLLLYPSQCNLLVIVFKFLEVVSFSFFFQKEIELKPERLSVQEWKKRLMGGTTPLCNDGEICGADSQNFLFCGKQNENSCMKPCQPGGIFSPTGLCGKLTKKACCCNKTTCSLCNRKKTTSLKLSSPRFALG